MRIDLEVLVLVNREGTSRALDRYLSKIEALRYKIANYQGQQYPLEGDYGAHRYDVVILETDEDFNDESLKQVRRFLEKHGEDTEVFTTSASEDLQLMKKLLRHGIRDVLHQPISEEELNVALTSAAERRHATSLSSRKRGSITSFLNTSANGPADFVAINIAWQLASRLQEKTALVDLDLQYGTVGVELDLEPNEGLIEALRSPERIDDVFLDAIMSHHASGLDVLPAPAGLGQYTNLASGPVSKLLTTLAETHQHVIVNLPVFMNDGVEEALRLSQPAFIVTHDKVAMLSNLKMLLQELPSRGVPQSAIEVIYQPACEKVSDVRPEGLRRIIGNVPFHRIRPDTKVAALAGNEGKAASELFPRSRVIRDIGTIAEKLAYPDEDTSKEASLIAGLPIAGTGGGNRKRITRWLSFS